MFQRTAPAHPAVQPAPRGWFWELDGANALALVMPRTGELRVVRGRVWVTTGDAAHSDHVLGPGDSLRMNAAQRLVVENWSRDEPARVEWWAPNARPACGVSRRTGLPAWVRAAVRGLAVGRQPRAH